VSQRRSHGEENLLCRLDSDTIIKEADGRGGLSLALTVCIHQFLQLSGALNLEENFVVVLHGEQTTLVHTPAATYHPGSDDQYGSPVKVQETMIITQTVVSVRGKKHYGAAKVLFVKIFKILKLRP
jgi:hypothetical protein